MKTQTKDLLPASNRSLARFRRQIIPLVIMTVALQIVSAILLVGWDRLTGSVIAGILALLVVLVMILGATWRVLLRFARNERRQAKAAQEARRFNDAILENAGALVVVLDREGRFLRFNRAAELVSGYSFEEVAGKCPWDTVLPPEIALETCEQAFKAMVARPSSTTSTYTNEWQTPDGSRCLIQWFNTMLFNETGQFECMISMGVDVTDRKRLVDQLEASESRLRAIWEAAPECIKLVDADCRLLEMNPAGLEMIGAASLDQVRGYSVLDLLKPDYREAYQQEVEDVFRGRSVKGEYEIIGLRGQTRWVEQQAVPLRDAVDPERVVQMLAVTRDVTQRRRAEENLRRSEKSYRALFETLPDSVFLLDEKGRILSANKAAALMHGYSVAELQTMNVADLNVPSEGVRVDNRLQAVKAKGGDAHRFVAAHRRKNGSDFLVEVVASAVQLGDETYILGIDRDVTERVQAQEALRRNEERLRLALEAANQGLFDLNIQTGEAVVSPTYAQMLGYDPAQFVETHEAWRQRLHPDDREPVMAAHADYVAGRTPQYRVEFRQRTQSGEWKWILSLGKIIASDSQGRPLRMLGTHTDISAIKEAQMQLRERDKELMHASRLSMAGGLAAAVAHELNQPLGAIANYTSVVSSGLELKTITIEQAIEYADLACTQALRAGNIIRKMRSLVDRQSTDRRRISPRQLIEDSLLLLRAEIQERRARVVWCDELEPGAQLPDLDVDTVLIEQLLLNVYQNALDSMATVTDRERVLTIVLRVPDRNWLEIEVTDTGAGLPQEQLVRLSESFYTTKPGGLGLGLAICRRIVQMHQGDIAISSEVGRGTQVTVTLPLFARA